MFLFFLNLQIVLTVVEIHNEMVPWQIIVERSGSVLTSGAGTPAIAEAIGIGAAIDCLSSIGMQRITMMRWSVVDVLNPLAREYKSIGTVKEEVAELQEDLAEAHKQAHISEARASAALGKLAFMEELMNESVVQKQNIQESDRLKNFWYPVAFSDDVKDDNLTALRSHGCCFVGKMEKLAVSKLHVPTELVHHLGSVVDGMQCPYHGWICVDLAWRCTSCSHLPSLKLPPGFVIHAEITMGIPIEHGLLIDNLLELAHAPFTHTSTFAKGCSVPSCTDLCSLLKFLTPGNGLQGHWDPYPIDMEFGPPCMVISTIEISKPGRLEGQNTRQCSTHLHQLHVCAFNKAENTTFIQDVF
ncbi:Chlorophyllide a oxygenase [Nymphaea thermarum]|nr:Chlorophyllide a oxygenase [Nymphaea thermarum]